VGRFKQAVEVATVGDGSGILGGDGDSDSKSGAKGGSDGPDGSNGDTPGEGTPNIGSSDFPDPVNVTSPYSPLAQLTSDEYVAALAELLGMPEADIQASPLRIALAPDPPAEGLVNAANRQRITQLGISGYASLSRSVAGEFLGDTDLQGYLDRLDCASLGGSPEECTRDYGEALMRRAFRGAFDDSDVERLDALMTGIDALFADEELDQTTALRRRFQAIVELIGLSPKFVLMAETGEGDDASTRELTQREVMNRMSFLLTGGPADEALLQTSEAMDLTTPEGRVALADALLSPETAAGAAEVLVRWLGVDDRADEASIETLRAFLEDWILEDRPFSDLYSAPFPVDYADGTVVEEPFGVLGSKAVIASNTSAPTPSFINRGEFVTARLLCAQLPEDLPDSALEADPVTPLEVFEVHNTDPCATCHKVFDNYGAALQRFDVDTLLYDPGNDWIGSSFELNPIGDVSGDVSDPGELGAVIGASEQAQACMTKLWYRHAVRRDLLNNGGDDEDVVEIANEWATSSDTSLRSLLRIIVANDGFAQLLAPED